MSLLVYIMCDVLLVQCTGSFLSCRHGSVLSFLCILLLASVSLIVVHTLGPVEKGCSKTSLLLLLLLLSLLGAGIA